MFINKKALVLEFALILVGIVFLFTPKGKLTLSKDDFSATDNGVITSTFSLPSGVWNLRLDYDAKVDKANYILISSDTVSYGALKTNEVMLYSEQEYIEYNFSLGEKNDAIRVFVSGGESAPITVSGVTLTKTNIPARLYIFWVVFSSIIVDAFIILKRKNWFSKTNIDILLALCAAVVLSCVPMMTNYIVGGGDLTYHLTRIQGLADSIKAGMFPARNFPTWLFGHGYADSIMYGHTLLYVPAVLRLIGFSIGTSYKGYVIFINICTVLVTYFSLKKVTRNEKAAVVAAFLYSLMPYRMFTLYAASNVGLYTGMSFIPLVMAGFWGLLNDDIAKDEYKRNKWYLIAGLSLILTNHVLSTEITVGFLFLFALVGIRKIFRKKTFIELLKAVGIFVLINIWFIVPFLDYYKTQNLHIRFVSGRTIQYRGILPEQLFTLFVKLDSQDMYGRTGLQGATVQTTGLVLTIAFLLFFVAFIRDKEFRQFSSAKGGLVIAMMSILTATMCTLYFPWDWFQSRNGLFRALVSSLQFPTRFLAFLGLMWVALAAILIAYFDSKKMHANILACVLVATSVICLSYFSSENLYYSTPLRLYDTTEMGTGTVSGGEYLPESLYGISNQKLKYRGVACGDGVEISEYHKEYLTSVISVSNVSETESYVDIPVLNYKGYISKDIDTNQKFETTSNDNYELRLIVPAGYSGTIKSRFAGMWYWHAADVISLVSLIVIFVYCILYLVGKKSVHENAED